MSKTVRTLIYLVIILQPFVDIITSLTTTYGNPAISLGSVCKFIIMGFLWIYVWHYFWKTQKGFLFIFLLSYSAILAMLVVNMISKPNVMVFAEMNFALKTAFFLTMLYICIAILLQRVDLRPLLYPAITTNACIIGLAYWAAILSKTSINSYTYIKPGYSGWFYAANELGVIVLMLLALTMMRVFEGSPPSTKWRMAFRWLAFGLMLSMVCMIGTKTAFYGGVLLLLLYGAVLLIRTHVIGIWHESRFIQLLAIGILFLLIIPFTPVSKPSAPLQIKSKPAQQLSVENQNPQPGRILSGRNGYLQTTRNQFQDAQPVRKLFGLGYAGDDGEDAKLVEMDFFDMLFGYGWIGTALLLLPLFYLAGKLRWPMASNEKFILLAAVAMCLGIALLAGHVLFAPAVMFYFAILILVIAGLSGRNPPVERGK